jgi:hypothetical protein
MAAGRQRSPDRNVTSLGSTVGASADASGSSGFFREVQPADERLEALIAAQRIEHWFDLQRRDQPATVFVRLFQLRQCLLRFAQAQLLPPAGVYSG